MWVDGDAASVEPDEAVDASTGSDLALLWTWTVHPKQPTERLRLTAHLSFTVPGTDHVLTRDLPLTMRVRRTAIFTFKQIFTNWATLWAIAVALLGGLAWVWRRWRRRHVPSMPSN